MNKTPKTPKKKSALSDDETALWQRVTESVTPLDSANRESDRVRVTGAGPNTPDKLTGAPASVKSAKPTQSASVRPGVKPAGSQPPLKDPPEPKGLGLSDVRKLRSGRIRIEARLDLHGMRQGEAHHALRHFLFSSQQRGLRWVMVITGKGGRVSRSETEAEHFDGFGRDAEPGVLRRNVPRWLQEPDLSALVIGFQSAGPQHGGDGALYVNLRRRDRVKS